MATGYNSATILATVTAQPDLRTTSSGKQVLDLPLACTTAYSKDRSETLYIDATCWGRLAEHCARHLDKGARVLVEGRLTTQEWVDKQTNQKRRKTKIVAATVLFVTKAKARDDNEPSREDEPPPEKEESPSPASAADDFAMEAAKDVPF